jgi:hypothetical protein
MIMSNLGKVKIRRRLQQDKFGGSPKRCSIQIWAALPISSSQDDHIHPDVTICLAGDKSDLPDPAKSVRRVDICLSNQFGKGLEWHGQTHKAASNKTDN